MYGFSFGSTVLWYCSSALKRIWFENQNKILDISQNKFQGKANYFLSLRHLVWKTWQHYEFSYELNMKTEYACIVHLCRRNCQHLLLLEQVINIKPWNKSILRRRWRCRKKAKWIMILMKAMKRNQINEFQLKSIKIDENLEM